MVSDDLKTLGLNSAQAVFKHLKRRDGFKDVIAKMSARNKKALISELESVLYSSYEVKYGKNKITKKKLNELFDKLKKEVEVKSEGGFSLSRVGFCGAGKPVTIHCNECNYDFSKTSKAFFAYPICPNCSRIQREKNFITNSKEIHGEQFNYSKVKYVDSFTPVQIHCNSCKTDFMQRPKRHLTGGGCTVCRKKEFESIKQDNLKKAEESFIAKVIEKYGNQFRFDDLDYKSKNCIIKVHCNHCNTSFERRAQSLLSGVGCLNCYHTKPKLKP